MKKILMMLVCCMVCWGIPACSDSNDDGPKNPEGSQTTEDGKITGLPNELSNLWGRGITDEWDGTSDVSWYDETKTVFLLTSAEQLAGLAELVNSGTTFVKKTVKLTVNIVLNRNIKFDAEGKVSNASELQKWIPIGRTYNQGDRKKESFRGSFDGGNHIISGLYINTTENNQGLFGCILCDHKDFHVVIKNVGIVSSYIRGGREVGAIVGNCYHFSNADYQTNIENCFNTGIVIGHGEVYGIGDARNIKHCFNRGTIRSEGEEGDAYGIGGFKNVSYCYNTGNIISKGRSYAISDFKINHDVDYEAVSVANCYNTGIIEGEKIYYFGNYLTVTNCATLYQKEKESTYPIKETLFRDNAGQLYYHDPDGTLGSKRPDNYSTLLECLNYGLQEDFLIWKVDPAKNGGYPIFIE